MILMNYILRKRTGGNRFLKSQEKVNSLMYKDDIKIFAKNKTKIKKELETLMRIYSLEWNLEWNLGLKNVP